jgi:hypothetical protein
MKFWMAIVVYLLIGLVLGWGIVLAVHGKPLFLIIALLSYIVAFAKIGCLTH